MTHDQVLEIVGVLADDQIARIMECDPQEDDLLAAVAWLNSDDSIEREIHHQPDSKIARLYEILASAIAVEDQ
jgi:hypothetical protein